MTPEEITEILRKELKPKRFKHTLGVMATARELAGLNGESVEKANLAGLLHDNAKSLELEKMRRIAQEAGLNLDAQECESSALMHAPVGAYLAKARFGVSDAAIIDAIRYHTTGKPDMSAFEAIIYLADMIEPSRAEFEGLDELRALTRRDLFAGLELGLFYSNSYVAERGQTLFKRSAEAYVWVKEFNEHKRSGRNADGV